MEPSGAGRRCTAGSQRRGDGRVPALPRGPLTGLPSRLASHHNQFIIICEFQKLMRMKGLKTGFFPRRGCEYIQECLRMISEYRRRMSFRTGEPIETVTTLGELLNSQDSFAYNLLDLNSRSESR